MNIATIGTWTTNVLPLTMMTVLVLLGEAFVEAILFGLMCDTSMLNLHSKQRWARSSSLSRLLHVSNISPKCYYKGCGSFLFANSIRSSHVPALEVFIYSSVANKCKSSECCARKPMGEVVSVFASFCVGRLAEAYGKMTVGR